MTLPVRKSLHDAVLQASKADTWEQATKEWNEVSLIFNGIAVAFVSVEMSSNTLMNSLTVSQANASFQLVATVFVIFIDCPLTSNWKRKKNCSERLKI